MKEENIIRRKEHFASLYLIYGKLLSRKTAKRMESFYLDDLSLSEIALNEGVSRSAVQQAIKDGEKELERYEEKVGVLKRTKRLEDLLDRLGKEEDDTKRKSLLKEAKGVLDNGI
ncbi:MAG TPA: transcriptional regulator [Candidatus Enterosoma merdigallinarum]|nr:transcriptional regulator [Candidatus Enterosoma merdigallinarum]